MNNVKISKFPLRLHFISSKPLNAVLNRLGYLKIIKSYQNCEREKKSLFALARELKDKGVVYCFFNNVNNNIYLCSTRSFTSILFKYYSLNYFFNIKVQ